MLRIVTESRPLRISHQLFRVWTALAGAVTSSVAAITRARAAAAASRAAAAAAASSLISFSFGDSFPLDQCRHRSLNPIEQTRQTGAVLNMGASHPLKRMARKFIFSYHFYKVKGGG